MIRVRWWRCRAGLPPAGRASKRILAAYALGGPEIWSWYSFMSLCLCAIFAAGVIVCWVALALARAPDRVTRNMGYRDRHQADLPLPQCRRIDD
jgi:hypothetical protein